MIILCVVCLNSIRIFQIQDSDHIQLEVHVLVNHSATCSPHCQWMQFASWRHGRHRDHIRTGMGKRDKKERNAGRDRFVLQSLLGAKLVWISVGTYLEWCKQTIIRRWYRANIFAGWRRSQHDWLRS